jgi:Ca-activated chloride channel family protein
VRLAYTDVLAGRGAEQQASVVAQVTERPQEVAAHQDREATVFAARAMGASNLQKAARALEAGRKEEARRYVQANESLLAGASAVAGAAPVAADVAAQRAALQEIDAAASAEDVAGTVKRQKARALKDFGRLGSTY